MKNRTFTAAIKAAVWLSAVMLFGVLPSTAMQTVLAAEQNEEVSVRGVEIVFLLDTSVSMNSQDKDRAAIDAVRQMAYSLPSGYKTGLVAYNTGIQSIIPFGTSIDQMEAQLTAITYTGYTNAGEGLNQAMGLFSDEVETERYIIMLTDGEIDMPDRQAREQSRSLYTEAAGKAKEKSVKIFIVAIGSELGDPGMHIFDGAELTDGAIYWEGQSGSLSQIMERITAERMSFPRQELGVNDVDAGGGSIRVEIPGGSSRMKLLITADGGIGGVTADYSAESGSLISGKNFAFIDISRPLSESAKVQFQTFGDSGAQAYLLTEYTASPQVQVTYRSEELPRTEEQVRKNIPPEYEHFADIVIELTDIGGGYKSLWKEDLYEGKEISYQLNGISYTGVLHEGQLTQTIPADGVEEVTVSVDTGGLGAIYYMEQPVTAKIEKNPDPAFIPVPDYRPLWGILGALAGALFVLLILWLKKKNTTVIYVAQPPASREPSKKLETKACTYSGKFNLYVIRTGDGRDIPPQTYRLFGRSAGRLTLNQILSSCGIKFGKIGAEELIFYPGPDHSVIMMDQSERCTVLRGTEILKKGIGYPVFYNEKITITFEDERTEMEIHYKNMKPSERAEL